jgi:hypothetical protein
MSTLRAELLLITARVRWSRFRSIRPERSSSSIRLATSGSWDTSVICNVTGA